MKTAGPILAIALAAALGACAQHNAQSAVAPNPGRGVTAQGAAGTCPLAQLHNLSATVEDTPDGVAITFTGPRDDRDQIRENVHAMEDANKKQGDAFASCPCGQAQSAGAAEAQGAQPGGLTSVQAAPRAAVAADAAVDNISTGAVLKLTAKNKGEIGALRDQAREDVQALRTECLKEGGKRGGYESPGQP